MRVSSTTYSAAVCTRRYRLAQFSSYDLRVDRKIIFVLGIRKSNEAFITHNARLRGPFASRTVLCVSISSAAYSRRKAMNARRDKLYATRRVIVRFFARYSKFILPLPHRQSRPNFRSKFEHFTLLVCPVDISVIERIYSRLRDIVWKTTCVRY